MKQHIYKWGNRNKTTLFFLHGMGSTGLSFGELAQYLMADFHVVSIDLPGHGHREALPAEQDYQPTCMVEQLMETVQELGQSEVYLIGHSWGAHLALYFASKYPEWVKGLVLLDGGYLQHDDRPDASLQKDLEQVEVFYDSVRFPSWEAFIESEKAELPRWSETLEAASRSQVIEKDGEIRLAASPYTCQALIKGIYEDPIETVFRKIKSPLLLIRSTLPEDMEGLRKRAVNRLQAAIPGAEVQVIVDATHDIYRDAPEETAERISLWVDGQG
ncbi:alpha/beta fold hydrolase [Tuberibacillus sp. Marseille-P3662]|uniref:alpha/beta fold hydrolase n=1 Tax=Tuberibacillus sp. Marseille-P3662 TaxID=1965358 RepID=UPI000A1CA083|nr:alpha/beta hydrolase [Tuberibacillus sp. Marseille-P3662]